MSKIHPEIEEPSQNQFPDKAGRRNSAFAGKLVYDSPSNKLSILPKQEVKIGKLQTQRIWHEADQNEPGDTCRKVKLPCRRNQVDLYVDPVTKTDLKTKMQTSEYGTYIHVARLHLDHLGTVPNTVRFFGGLSTLYVRGL